MTSATWSRSPTQSETGGARCKRLRVLYLQPSPLFGGAERQAALIAPLLPRHGIDVVPMVGPGRVVARWFAQTGSRGVVHSESFPGLWSEQHGLSRVAAPLRFVTSGLRVCAEIAEQVRQCNPDVIVASLPFAWITGGLVAKRNGVPIIWRAGGIGPTAAQKLTLAAWAHAMPPELLLCNAEAVRRVFGPLVPAPTAVVPNGIDLSVFHPEAGDRGQYRPPGDRLVVGSAMRLAPSKRPQDFVALAARLRRTHPHVRLLLAGDGEERARLERMARSLGADNLSFLGFVPDMPSFYRACDVLALTSSSEGSSNFVLEAMAMGKPLVLASIAPARELLGDPAGAAWFSLGDVDGLTRGTLALLEDAQRRRALSIAGLSRAREFSLEQCASRLARVLYAVCAPRRRAPGRAALRPPLPSEPDRQALAAE